MRVTVAPEVVDYVIGLATSGDQAAMVRYVLHDEILTITCKVLEVVHSVAPVKLLPHAVIVNDSEYI